ncbi:Imm32 family immunity protein [Mangrovitalea sediminis]|uniref:Imm32 family immunity protein n=1 Tax=Mangrovitalea sediminis TaxID=1982043 RepID=UPI000BE5326A|nr:hypothetical protein [Mangrovitalea sediminis]
MKIYGYEKSEKISDDEIVPAELAEITLVADAEELRKIASFIYSAADEIERLGSKWEHEHLADSYPDFEGAPHFVVFNPDAE